jgi:hypothetical protein
MICTTAAIVYFLGYMPPRGTVISVPRSQAEQYTPRQVARAQACAARHGIRWQIVG